MQELPLQQISLRDIAAVDLTPLAGHPTLRDLVLGDDVAACGLDTLGQLPALERVSLSTPGAEAGAAELIEHPRIEELIFSDDIPLQLAARWSSRFRGNDADIRQLSGTY